MRDIRIVMAEPHHVYLLAPNLRAGDLAEIEAAGLEAEDTIRKSVENSIEAHTAFVDGEIAAMWGMSVETILGDVGQPWLLTAPHAVLGCKSLLRYSLGFVRRWIEVFPRLEGYTDARYLMAIRMLYWMGFTVHEPEPYGLFGRPFRRFEMRRA